MPCRPYPSPGFETAPGVVVAARALAVALGLTAGAISAARAEGVPSGYQAIASEQGLPATLLYAVAMTESGQSHLSRSHWRPWPWTLNIKGRGHYFVSRQAAWRALLDALAEEDPSVDIGLMQVNWRYHRRDLGSPWQALEPYHNLRVGAAILKRCHTPNIDWWDSVGCYHAPNDPARAQRYRERVRGHWQALSRDAREHEPG